MKEIPKKLNILGHEYNIVQDKKLLEQEKEWSVALIQENQIILDETASEDRKYSLLFHEICEVINWQCDLKLNHQQLSVLEANLWAVLKDNKLDLWNNAK